MAINLLQLFIFLRVFLCDLRASVFRSIHQLFMQGTSDYLITGSMHKGAR